jgi:hypothetical protein
MTMTIKQQLEAIAEAFGAKQSISFDAAEKALDLLDKAPREALELLVARRVSFLWMPARRRLREKFGVEC